MNDRRRLGFTAWEFGTNRPSSERQAPRRVEWRCGPLFQEPRESETRSRSQLSPQLSAAAHSWQTAHSGHSQGGGVGGRTQQTRGNLSLGGSWQAGGASGRTGTGRVREEGRSLFACLILQGLLNKNLQCYVSR